MSRGMGKDKLTLPKDFDASPDFFGGAFLFVYYLLTLVGIFNPTNKYKTYHVMARNNPAAAGPAMQTNFPACRL